MKCTGGGRGKEENGMGEKGERINKRRETKNTDNRINYLPEK